MKLFRMVSLNLRAMDTRFIEFDEMSAINYHIKPGLYLKMDNIESGGVELSPAGYLVKDPEDMILVEQKIFSRQSNDRINLMFKNEKVSASMSEEEEELFRKLLDEQNFISNKVTIYYKGKEVSYFGLPLGIQEDLKVPFETFRIQHVVDMQNEEMSFDEFREEVYKEAFNKAQEELRGDVKSFQSKHSSDDNRQSKKKLRASMALGFGIAGGVMEMLGNNLSKRSNIKANALSIPIKGAGKVCAVLSTASSASLARELLGGDYV